MSTAPLTTRTAGRRRHSLRRGHICPCCESLPPRSGAAQRQRRTQRRIEAQTWKAEARDA
jgi:hypothetical protein